MCRLIALAVFTFCLTAILVPVQLAARDDGRYAVYVTPALAPGPRGSTFIAITPRLPPA